MRAFTRASKNPVLRYVVSIVWSVKCSKKTRQKEKSISGIPRHLCFNQAPLNMCRSSKVDERVEIF